VLSQWGYSVPAFTAALISFLNLLAIFFFLPESLTPERRENLATHQRPPFTLKALLMVLNRPIVGPLLHVRLFYGLAFATFQSIFSLYAQSIGLSSQTTGFVLAYVGLLAVITQAGLIGPLTRRFRETWLIISGLWIMGISLLAWAFTAQLWPLLLVILPLSLSGGVLNTVMQSSISKSVSRDEIGGILGITASLDALTRVVAPSLGGFLLGYFGRWAPGVFTALLMAWAVSFSYRRIIIPARRLRMESEVEGSHA
jgi:DHA1 family tetracycline resistance protein-like MFS transporter